MKSDLEARVRRLEELALRVRLPDPGRSLQDLAMLRAAGGAPSAAPPTVGVFFVTVTDSCVPAFKPGAVVTARRAGEADVSGTTDAGGHVNLTVPTAGDWTLTSVLAGYPDVTKVATAVIGETTVVSFPHTNTILRVRTGGCTGRPLTGVAVNATQGSVVLSGTTVLVPGPFAQVDFYVPTAGTWTLAFSKARFVAGTGSGTVASCGTTAITTATALARAAGYRCGPGCADPYPETLVITDSKGTHGATWNGVEGGNPSTWRTANIAHTRAGRLWSTVVNACQANAAVAGFYWYTVQQTSAGGWTIQQQWFSCQGQTNAAGWSDGTIAQNSALAGATTTPILSCAVPLSLSFTLPTTAAFDPGNVVTVTEA